MKAVAPTACAVMKLDPPKPATEPPIAEIVESLSGVERVALLVVDALGVLPW